jgi:hypothetical protein
MYLDVPGRTAQRSPLGQPTGVDLIWSRRSTNQLVVRLQPGLETRITMVVPHAAPLLAAERSA